MNENCTVSTLMEIIVTWGWQPINKQWHKQTELQTMGTIHSFDKQLLGSYTRLGLGDVIKSETVAASVPTQLTIERPFFPSCLWRAPKCWPTELGPSDLLTLHPRHHICLRSCLDLLLKAVALSDKLSISHRGWREGLNDITGFFYLVTQRQENINFYFCKFIPF